MSTSEVHEAESRQPSRMGVGWIETDDITGDIYELQTEEKGAIFEPLSYLCM